MNNKHSLLQTKLITDPSNMSTKKYRKFYDQEVYSPPEPIKVECSICDEVDKYYRACYYCGRAFCSLHDCKVTQFNLDEKKERCNSCYVNYLKKTNESLTKQLEDNDIKVVEKEVDRRLRDSDFGEDEADFHFLESDEELD